MIDGGMTPNGSRGMDRRRLLARNHPQDCAVRHVDEHQAWLEAGERVMLEAAGEVQQGLLCGTRPPKPAPASTAGFISGSRRSGSGTKGASHREAVDAASFARRSWVVLFHHRSAFLNRQAAHLRNEDLLGGLGSTAGA